MNFSLILVRPEIAENLGFIARLAANFGVSPLKLVGSETRALAASKPALITAVHAKPQLEESLHFPTLEGALEESSYTLGFSTKASDPRHPTVDLDHLQIPDGHPTVGLVFGPESQGLSREELERCHQVVAIPTAPQYPSLNLSHAVAIALYKFSSPLLPLPRIVNRNSQEESQASPDLVERAFHMWQDYLKEIGFTHPTNERSVARDLRRLLSRLHGSRREIKFLMGMINQSYWALQNQTQKTHDENHGYH